MTTPARRNTKRWAFTLLMILGLIQPLWAHMIPAELEKMSKTDAASLYLQLGYLHILPFGFDHTLFILSLFLLSSELKPFLWQAIAFTVAHSVTLFLAMYHIITPVEKMIEPLITLSILYVAMENIFSPRLKPARIAVVFLSGLAHGMGFAGALGQIGLPLNAYFLSLIMFNAGIELGQLTVIILAYLLLAKWFGNKPYYRKAVVIPISAVIAIVAAGWTIGRIIS